MSKATVLTDRFDRALLYATHVHGGQVRKETSIPYIAHLLAVAAAVLEYGGDEDLAIAALLHDSVEDQGGRRRLDDVHNRFGERVARIVEGCSDSLADTGKGEPKADSKKRKEAYLAHLREADEDTLTVSLADKVHNALGDQFPPRLWPLADVGLPSWPIGRSTRRENDDITCPTLPLVPA
jgi:(p)ppGpp synthase/HD superfamily hydrolase